MSAASSSRSSSAAHPFVHPVPHPAATPQPSARIFCGGIAPNVGLPEIRDFFSSFGRVVDVFAPRASSSTRHKGYAFVEFDSADAAGRVWSAVENAPHSLSLGGRPLIIDRADPRGPPGTSAAAMAAAAQAAAAHALPPPQPAPASYPVGESSSPLRPPSPPQPLAGGWRAPFIHPHNVAAAVAAAAMGTAPSTTLVEGTGGWGERGPGAPGPDVDADADADGDGASVEERERRHLRETLPWEASLTLLAGGGGGGEGSSRGGLWGAAGGSLGALGLGDLSGPRSADDALLLWGRNGAGSASSSASSSASTSFPYLEGPFTSPIRHRRGPGDEVTAVSSYRAQGGTTRGVLAPAATTAATAAQTTSEAAEASTAPRLLPQPPRVGGGGAVGFVGDEREWSPPLPLPLPLPIAAARPVGEVGPDGGAGPDDISRRVFVGKLGPSTTPDSLRRHFSDLLASLPLPSPAAHVEDVFLPLDSGGRPRGFAFVSFTSRDAVEAVMTVPHHVVDGRSLVVDAAVPRGAPTATRTGGGMGAGPQQPQQPQPQPQQPQPQPQPQPQQPQPQLLPAGLHPGGPYLPPQPQQQPQPIQQLQQQQQQHQQQQLPFFGGGGMPMQSYATNAHAAAFAMAAAAMAAMGIHDIGGMQGQQQQQQGGGFPGPYGFAYPPPPPPPPHPQHFPYPQYPQHPFQQHPFHGVPPGQGPQQPQQPQPPQQQPRPPLPPPPAPLQSSVSRGLDGAIDALNASMAALDSSAGPGGGMARGGIPPPLVAAVSAPPASHPSPLSALLNSLGATTGQQPQQRVGLAHHPRSLSLPAELFGPGLLFRPPTPSVALPLPAAQPSPPPLTHPPSSSAESVSPSTSSSSAARFSSLTPLTMSGAEDGGGPQRLKPPGGARDSGGGGLPPSPLSRLVSELVTTPTAAAPATARGDGERSPSSSERSASEGGAGEE
jgi:RNA recognition motif-containing protein